MSKQQICQILRESRFSAGLSEAGVERIADAACLTDFPEGTTIFAEGTDTSQLYLLQSGRVELCMNVPTRGCLPILTLEEGDLLGWSAVLGEQEMTATAVAVTDTQAIALEADQLRELCAQDHDIGFEIMRRVAVALSRRLVAARLQVLDLFADTLPQPASANRETTP